MADALVPPPSLTTKSWSSAPRSEQLPVEVDELLAKHCANVLLHPAE
ncbi:hypothetical protein [Streptomyces sp. NPDC058463]